MRVLGSVLALLVFVSAVGVAAVAAGVRLLRLVKGLVNAFAG